MERGEDQLLLPRDGKLLGVEAMEHFLNRAQFASGQYWNLLKEIAD